MDRFAGRVAIVTGVSSGIGEQITEQLVKAGVVVVGVARRQQRLTELAARLASEKGKLHPIAADFSREDEIHRVYKWVDDNLGGVSVIVNNAAVLTLVALQNLDVSTVQQVVNLNLTSVMLSCREALLSMKKHAIKDGHIININSVAGHIVLNMSPQYSTTVYAASKHAITAFCKGLRYDVQAMEGFKIRVTSISPGAVATEMLPGEYVNSLEDVEDVLKAKDVADAVCYVLSCPRSVEISELTIRPTGEKAS